MAYCRDIRPLARLCSIAYDFAAQLFDLAELGMRVIVAPERRCADFYLPSGIIPAQTGYSGCCHTRVAEAEEAAGRLIMRGAAVFMASRELVQAAMALRRMRYLKLREEERLADVALSVASAKWIEAKEAAGCKGEIDNQNCRTRSPWL